VTVGSTIRRARRCAKSFLLATNAARMNRHDVRRTARCRTVFDGGLPEFGTAYGGSFRRIVQTPGGISMFYDVGQGKDGSGTSS